MLAPLISWCAVLGALELGVGRLQGTGDFSGSQGGLPEWHLESHVPKHPQPFPLCLIIT